VAGPAARTRQPAPASPGRHPLTGLGGTITRLPSYVKLGRRLLAEPNLSRRRKLVLGAALAYAVSPIDLVPGIIPVAGQLDDLAAVLIALRAALGGLSNERAEALLSEAGLSTKAIHEDITNVAVASGWLARRAVDVGKRGLDLGLRGVRVGVGLGVRGVSAGLRTAAGSAAAIGSALRRRPSRS
jgi:uncharacterized membrane protein YkvA (DUF1232 family)